MHLLKKRIFRALALAVLFRTLSKFKPLLILGSLDIIVKHLGAFAGLIISNRFQLVST